ncbi:hypothetical protein GN956_G25936 [Arapaima gigas]
MEENFTRTASFSAPLLKKPAQLLVGRRFAAKRLLKGTNARRLSCEGGGRWTAGIFPEVLRVTVTRPGSRGEYSRHEGQCPKGCLQGGHMPGNQPEGGGLFWENG